MGEEEEEGKLHSLFEETVAGRHLGGVSDAARTFPSGTGVGGKITQHVSFLTSSYSCPRRRNPQYPARDSSLCNPDD